MRSMRALIIRPSQRGGPDLLNQRRHDRTLGLQIHLADCRGDQAFEPGAQHKGIFVPLARSGSEKIIAMRFDLPP